MERGVYETGLVNWGMLLLLLHVDIHDHDEEVGEEG